MRVTCAAHSIVPSPHPCALLFFFQISPSLPSTSQWRLADFGPLAPTPLPFLLKAPNLLRYPPLLRQLLYWESGALRRPLPPSKVDSANQHILASVICSGMGRGPTPANEIDERDVGRRLCDIHQERSFLAPLWKVPGQALPCVGCKWGSMWPGSNWQPTVTMREARHRTIQTRSLVTSMSCWISLA